MTTIIDHSEKLTLLTVAPTDALTIEHDKNTPKYEHEVRVSTKGIALGLGSTVLLQHHGELVLNGVVSADVLGTIDIGNNGKLYLNSSVGVGLLSNIQFTNNSHGPAFLLINTASVSLTGNITGFGERDTMVLRGLGAVSASWTQGPLDSGTLALFNASGTLVDAIGLNGEYTTANFAVSEKRGAHGTDATRITFVAQGAGASAQAHGFTVPEAHSAASAAAPSTGSMRELQSVETAASHFCGGFSHHG